MVSKILKIFNDSGIELTENIADNLYTYYNFLIEENNKVNLTSITEFDEVIIKHFLDSAYIVKFIPEISSSKIIDVGTGAGFPGMVLAILCSETNVTLLETLGKRVDFLMRLREQLSLDNVTIIKSRAEDGGKDNSLRESFDYAVSRAVAPLNILSEYLIPFIKVNGSVIAYKSGNLENEISESAFAISTLGGSDPIVKRFSLPNETGDRAFVISKKIKPTPPSYPRRAGIPSKRPIL